MLRFRRVSAFGSIAGVCFALAGCMTAADHAVRLPSASERQLTLGIVQRDIHKGQAQAEVASALGAPNIVSQDAAGAETWIYDRIATETAYSVSSSSAGIGGLGVGAGFGALGDASTSQASGAASQTQRTLTVIIKFKKGLVDDINYHSSSF